MSDIKGFLAVAKQLGHLRVVGACQRCGAREDDLVEVTVDDRQLWLCDACAWKAGK